MENLRAELESKLESLIERRGKLFHHHHHQQQQLSTTTSLSTSSPVQDQQLQAFSVLEEVIDTIPALLKATPTKRNESP